MLRPFTVLEPSSVEEAGRELARLGEDTRVYAGGTELLVLMRHGFVRVGHLVNIKKIPGLNDLSWDGQKLRIGATVTHHRLETDPTVHQHLPMFAYAESQVANIRVRNQGTLGGNLSFSDPHSDPGTALLVYDATVTVAGPKGQRQLPLNEFFLGMYETALKEDEILVEVQVSPLAPGLQGAYLRIHRYQRPTLGVAAAVGLQDSRLDNVRFAVGCIGPKPLRLTEIEKKVQGLTVEEARKVLMESGNHIRTLMRPVDDLMGSADYKIYLTRVLLARALSQAVASNGGTSG